MGKITKQIRPKRRKEKIGLDALTICFLTTDSIFDRIKDGEELQWWGEENGADFFTYRIDKESDDRTLVVKINIPDGEDTVSLGTLTVHGKENKI